MCKFYKFYICAVVGVIIEFLEILTKTYKPRNRNIKSRDVSVLTDEKGILSMWNEHFRGEQRAQEFGFYENVS